MTFKNMDFFLPTYWTGLLHIRLWIYCQCDWRSFTVTTVTIDYSKDEADSSRDNTLNTYWKINKRDIYITIII